MKRILFLLLASFCTTLSYAQSGIITTILGNGGTIDRGLGGMATAASITSALCKMGPDGNLYVSLEDLNEIRIVTPDGRYLPFAGNGSSIAGGGDGGPASAASISYPSRMAFDSHGDFYVSEGHGNRIRKIDMHTGIISTYAGGRYTSTIDTGYGGLATNASFYPGGLTFDKDDNLFIGTGRGHLLRVDRVTQILTWYAGNGGSRSYGGDGGPATNAAFDAVGIQVDSSGRVYFDNLTYIRTIDPATHIVTCMAGNDTIGRAYAGDGCAPTATAMNPHDIQFDKHGNLVMGDFGNIARILCISKSDNRVYTLAGTGVIGYSGDGGPATVAKIYSAQAVTIDSCDNVYFSDVPNFRIRKISIPQTGPLSITIAPSSTVENLCYDMPITFTATLGNPGYWGNYQWTVNSLPVGGNSNQFTYTPTNGDTVRCSISHRWACDTTTGATSNSLVMLVGSLTPPTISLPGGAVTAHVGDTVHVTATISGAAGVYEIHWRNRGTWFATTTTPALSYIKAAGNDTLTATLVSIARTCYDSVSSGTQNILGITPIPLLGQLQLTCHPNPGTQSVTLSWGSLVPPRINIYNATGIQVYEGTPTGDEQNIDLRNWSPGVYYIKCEGYQVFRLVKM